MAKTLELKGNEKVRESALSHMCNHNGCWKSINPGDPFVKDDGRTYTIRISCAIDWCDKNGVEARYL